jgi:hypothetical protein
MQRGSDSYWLPHFGASHQRPKVELSGTATVVDESATPLGAGWGIAGINQLVPVQGGVLWVTGNGEGRFFAENPDGSFTNPAEDFGTLLAYCPGELLQKKSNHGLRAAGHSGREASGACQRSGLDRQGRA